MKEEIRPTPLRISAKRLVGGEPGASPGGTGEDAHPPTTTLAFRLFSSKVKSHVITQEFAFMIRIHKVAILGAGTMGARIAAHFANAGVPSLLLDIVPPNLPPDADRASRNKIAAAGLDEARKSKPAAFFEASLSRLVSVGN